MTSEEPRKVKSIVLEIFMQSELDSQKNKVLQSITEKYSFKLNLEVSIYIHMNWHC